VYLIEEEIFNEIAKDIRKRLLQFIWVEAESAWCYYFLIISEFIYWADFDR
jgi:hypothetical protein